MALDKRDANQNLPIGDWNPRRGCAVECDLGPSFEGEKAGLAHLSLSTTSKESPLLDYRETTLASRARTPQRYVLDILRGASTPRPPSLGLTLRAPALPKVASWLGSLLCRVDGRTVDWRSSGMTGWRLLDAPVDAVGKTDLGAVPRRSAGSRRADGRCECGRVQVQALGPEDALAGWVAPGGNP